MESIRYWECRDGEKYRRDDWGVWGQVEPKVIAYDKEYLDRHTDKPNYANAGRALNYLRMGMVMGTVGRVPESLLDYGCGDGGFVRQVRESGWEARGFDVHGVGEVGEIVRAEVYTFWDVMEHLPDLNMVKKLECRFVVVSLPWMPGIEEFDEWKHRRPGEHLWHFREESLVRWMRECGWEKVWTGSMEDVVRGRLNGRENILSGGFKRYE